MTTSPVEPLKEADLRQFTGSETWYRHGLCRSILYTDGAQYLAEKGGAYWLLDEIALANCHEKFVMAESFQLWTLNVLEDRSATLICEDGNGEGVYVKRIEFTDFPLNQIKLFFTDNTILLPSEY